MREKEAVNEDMEIGLVSIQTYFSTLKRQLALMGDNLISFQMYLNNLRNQVILVGFALTDGDFASIDVINPAKDMREVIKMLQDEVAELNVEGLNTEIEMMKKLQDEATEFDREEEARDS